jgi:hypothetical protein
MKLTVAYWRTDQPDDKLPVETAIEIPFADDCSVSLTSDGEIGVSLFAEMLEAVNEALPADDAEFAFEDVSYFVPLAEIVTHFIEEYRAGDGELHLTDEDRRDYAALADLFDNCASQLRVALRVKPRETRH